jgi:hypothetical protein
MEEQLVFGQADVDGSPCQLGVASEADVRKAYADLCAEMKDTGRLIGELFIRQATGNEVDEYNAGKTVS